MIDTIKQKFAVNTDSTAVPVTAMALLVSERCNLSCVYCYGEDESGRRKRNMNRQVAFKAVDWLIDHSLQERHLRLVFFGGEPLINFGLMKEVAAYAKHAATSNEKKIEFQITTNGSMITPEVIHFFKQYDVIPLISFDGPKEIHDKQRPGMDGHGSYNKTVPLIRDLLKEFPQTPCRATWMEGSDPDEVIGGLRNIGFKRIFLLPASVKPPDTSAKCGIPCNNEPFSLIRKAEQDAETILRCVKDRDTAGIRFFAGASILLSLTEMMIKNIKKETPCGAARQMVAVAVNGDLFPCHRFTGFPEFMIGNVYSDDLNGSFKPFAHIDDIAACKSCKAKYTCSGGCYHDHMISTGNYAMPSEESCKRKKALTAIAEGLSAGFDASDLNFLHNEKIIQFRPCTLDFTGSNETKINITKES